MHTYRIGRLIALLALLLAVAPAAYGQSMSSADKVEVETRLSHSGVTPGSDIKVAVVMDIEDGWHVNANQPLQEYFIGTVLSINPPSELLLSDTRYPEPVLEELDFEEDEMALYYGSVPVFLSFRVSEDAEPGEEYAVEGTLGVQACDDEVCLAPSEKEISFTVPVVSSDEDIEALDRGLFSEFDAAASGGEPQQGTAAEIAALFDERGWLLAFLTIFVIGLALNLTPCVYPMMSVTVSLFTAQQEASIGRSFSRALVYVLGIATMYSVLGVAAAYTGALFGAWLQHPVVVGAIALLLFALALSMFGLFELQPPAWMTQRLGAAHQVSGMAGLYLSGVVVGIFAAPCIGPPIIALLAFVGAQGDPAFGLAAFFVLSLGLGLPYLILGTFSSLLDQLPKSGVWMVWVKKLFGVVLVGAAFFYLGLVAFPQYVVYVLPVTLLVGGAFLGFFEGSGAPGSTFRRFKWALGVVSVVAGLLVFHNLQQPGLEWEEYSPERLAEARENGQPVMVDFTADWCIPCIELDRVTFTDGRVIGASEDFVLLKVDLTNFNSSEAEELRDRHDVAGVPTIIFFGEDGEEVLDARVVGFLGPERFVERLERVRS